MVKLKVDFNEHKVPSTAIMIYSKPWTPKMIMAYRKISPSRYKKLREKYTPQQILENDAIFWKQKVNKFSDRTGKITLGKREWTYGQIYYVFIKNYSWITPVSYASFRNGVSQVIRYHQVSLLEALDVWFSYKGMSGNFVRDLVSMTDEKFADMEIKYQEYITKYRKDNAEVDFPSESPPHPNEFWEEYLHADKQMREYAGTVCANKLKTALENLRKANDYIDRQSIEINRLQEELNGATKQILELSKTNRELQAKIEKIEGGQDPRRES